MLCIPLALAQCTQDHRQPATHLNFIAEGADTASSFVMCENKFVPQNNPTNIMRT